MSIYMCNKKNGAHPVVKPCGRAMISKGEPGAHTRWKLDI